MGKSAFPKVLPWCPKKNCFWAPRVITGGNKLLLQAILDAHAELAAISTKVPVTYTAILTRELSTPAECVSTLGIEGNTGFVRLERETSGLETGRG